MRAPVQVTLFCLSAFHAAIAGAQFAEDRPGGATYDPRTGRIVVTVADALAWLIESASGQLTGPDDVVLTGVLPATPFFPEVSLVTNEDFYIGEANFRFPHFAYGPLDLGRVAQLNIPMGDLVFYCLCPLNATEQIELVRYVPEPTTILSGGVPRCLAFAAELVAMLVSLVRWNRGGIGTVSGSFPGIDLRMAHKLPLQTSDSRHQAFVGRPASVAE